MLKKKKLKKKFWKILNDSIYTTMHTDGLLSIWLDLKFLELGALNAQFKLVDYWHFRLNTGFPVNSDKLFEKQSQKTVWE